MRSKLDQALLKLAQEREKVNALRLAFPPAEEPPLPEYPESAGPGAPPLRYVLVDAANDHLKRYLEPLQREGKELARRALETLARRGNR